MKLIDTHCHLQDARFLDLKSVLERAEKAGVSKMICCGTRPSDWPQVMDLACQFPQVHPMLGLHPWHAAEVPDEWLQSLERLLIEDAKLGVGECGLDGAVDVDMGLQRDVFTAQLDLATRLKRPLSIHCRKAWAPLLESFDAVNVSFQGAMHAFSGSWEMAQECLKRGLYLSFTCRVADPRFQKARKILENCRLDRMLLETDAPDMGLTTAPNEPAQMLHALKAAAEIKGMDQDLLADQLLKNSRQAFGI